MCPNEKSIKASRAEFRKIVMGSQAGFANGDAIVRNARDEFERSLDAHGKCSQIAIIYAQDACAGPEGALKLAGRVHLDEWLHPKLAAERDEITKQTISECSQISRKLSASLARVSHTCQ